jgi:hypothetical protein
LKEKEEWSSLRSGRCVGAVSFAPSGLCCIPSSPRAHALGFILSSLRD